MSKRFVIEASALSFALVLGALFLACGDVDDNVRGSITPDDGTPYAKYMHLGQDCRYDNLVVVDCLDACTCCHLGRTHDEARDICVKDCDTVLLDAQNNANPGTAEWDLFQRCIVGCFSDCEVDRPLQDCALACSSYL